MIFLDISFTYNTVNKIFLKSETVDPKLSGVFICKLCFRENILLQQEKLTPVFRQSLAKISEII